LAPPPAKQGIFFGAPVIAGNPMRSIALGISAWDEKWVRMQSGLTEY